MGGCCSCLGRCCCGCFQCVCHGGVWCCTCCAGYDGSVENENCHANCLQWYPWPCCKSCCGIGEDWDCQYGFCCSYYNNADGEDRCQDICMALEAVGIQSDKNAEGFDEWIEDDVTPCLCCCCVSNEKGGIKTIKTLLGDQRRGTKHKLRGPDETTPLVQGGLSSSQKAQYVSFRIEVTPNPTSDKHWLNTTFVGGGDLNEPPLKSVKCHTVRDPTAWTITRHDSPNQLGL